MSRRDSIQRLLSIAFALGLFASHPVFAACASPYGLAGNTQVGTGGTLYKCDGTNWNAAASLPSLTSTDVWVGNTSNVATATATTGTGNVVMSASPTLTGTVTGAASNWSGNVGIGTTNPATTLDVNGQVYVRSSLLVSTTSSNWFGLEPDQTESPVHGSIVNTGVSRLIQFNLTTPFTAVFAGTIYDTDGAVHSSSDRRLKKDIEPLDGVTALAKIGELNPVRFRWINPDLHEHKEESGGFIAQEIQKTFPHVVDEAECRGADCALVGGKTELALGLTPEFFAYMAKAVQQLNIYFDMEHREFARLKADNDNLRAQLKTANDNEAAEIKLLTARLNKLEATRH